MTELLFQNVFLQHYNNMYKINNDKKKLFSKNLSFKSNICLPKAIFFGATSEYPATIA